MQYQWVLEQGPTFQDTVFANKLRKMLFVVNKYGLFSELMCHSKLSVPTWPTETACVKTPHSNFVLAKAKPNHFNGYHRNDHNVRDRHIAAARHQQMQPVGGKSYERSDSTTKMRPPHLVGHQSSGDI